MKSRHGVLMPEQDLEIIISSLYSLKEKIIKDGKSQRLMVADAKAPT